jgi:hypothetical protein
MTCSSEEPDSTISTTTFHDWLPSQGKTKATIRETITYAKNFYEFLLAKIRRVLRGNDNFPLYSSTN